MPKNWNFKLVAVLLLSLFLIACGGGKSNDPEQSPSPQVLITNASINLEKVSIDLNQNNSANVVLTRKFDDESETTINLVISWDAENLVLKDEADNLIALEFNKDALLAGEAAIKFKDPESNLDIEFTIELVPEQSEPAITEIFTSLDKLTIDLNTSDTSSVNLISKYDDNSESSEQLNFSWVKESDSLILKTSNDIEIALNYDSSSLNKNSIPVTFVDPVSNIELSIEIVIKDVIIDPIDLSIKKYVLAPDNVELSIGDETVLSLSVIMSDDSQGTVPNDVSCQLDSISDVVSVSSDCKVVALQAGEVKVTIMRTEAVNDSLIEKANITVLAESKPEPAITVSKVEINEKTPTLIQGLELPLTLTLTYSNDEIKDNQFDIVECRSSSSFISITSDCIVTGISPGKAIIDLVMLTSDTPTLIGSEIEITAPSITQLRMSPQNLFLQNGDSQLFKVFADYNNGASVDVTADTNCLVSSDVLLVTELCDITANKNGSAQVTPTLKDGSVVDVVLAASVEVSEAIVIYSGDYLMLIAEDFDGGLDVNISCSADFNLGLESNCEIFAFYPGSYQITATLRNASTGGVIDIVSRLVIVKAVPLGDYSLQSEFSVDIPPDVYDIFYEISNVSMDETYKVTLFDPLLSPDVKMAVLPDFLNGRSCLNTVPSGALEYQVACGVATLSDKIYVHISPTPLHISTGLNAKIRVVPDDNVLKYDGPLKVEGGSNSAYLNAYEFVPLTVGEALVDGHVPANLDGLNVSRYYSSVPLGMNTAENAGNFYTVSVKFDSPNYDSRSAIIRWYSAKAGDEAGEPNSQCIPQSDSLETNTLTCTFDNIKQAYIFVEIHGNGVDNLGLSNITAVDGEIGYSIKLTQSPPP